MTDKVWTAEELEGLTPAEQDALFESSLERALPPFHPSSSNVSGTGSTSGSLTASFIRSERRAADSSAPPPASLRISIGNSERTWCRGRPSANDFQVFELIHIVDRFATDFDELPGFSGRPDCRILISVGMLVPRFAVVAQLAPDGAVELVQLDIDLEAGSND